MVRQALPQCLLFSSRRQYGSDEKAISVVVLISLCRAPANLGVDLSSLGEGTGEFVLRIIVQQSDHVRAESKYCSYDKHVSLEVL
jgi:hypothetical protein